MADMDHANVVGYFDSFLHDGALHIVMEYCDKVHPEPAAAPIHKCVHTYSPARSP